MYNQLPPTRFDTGSGQTSTQSAYYIVHTPTLPKQKLVNMTWSFLYFTVTLQFVEQFLLCWLHHTLCKIMMQHTDANYSNLKLPSALVFWEALWIIFLLSSSLTEE